MPIITKAGTPVKGSPTLFTLNKSTLAAVTSVAADSYFSDSSSWKEVLLVYKSATGSQKALVKFNAILASPTANFAVSAKALDIFQIHKIVIKDFDGDTFQVPRSALITSEFDVDMSNSASAILWVNPAPNVYNIETDGGLTIGPNRGGATYYDITASTQIFTGDFELIYEVGVWTHDSGFGVFTLNNGNLYSGAVGYGGGSSNNMHVNNSAVSVASGLSGKQWKIKRVGSTTTFYTDGAVSFTTTAIVGPVMPVATLTSGGTLLSASYN